MPEYLVFVVMVSRDGDPPRSVYSAAMRAAKEGGWPMVAVVVNSFSVANARNEATEMFLRARTADGRSFTHTLFIDDDTIVPADTIPQLLQCDSDIALGCAGALHLASHRWRSFVSVKNDQNQWLTDWKQGVFEAAGGSLGCALIRREVFAKVGEPVGGWFHWPDVGRYGYDFMGEDNLFCREALKAGCTIRANGWVRCGHKKTVDLSTFVGGGLKDGAYDWPGPLSYSDLIVPPLYGSHVPALIAVAKTIKRPIKKVIEYGCGYYSTQVFLDRTMFPELEQLLSVDDNQEWAETIEKATNDPRLKLIVTPQEDQAAFAAENAADVILVDSGADAWDKSRIRNIYKRRLDTLQACAKHRPCTVLLHDVEHHCLMEALDLNCFERLRVFQPQGNPHTAIFSNDDDYSGVNISEVFLRYFNEVRSGASNDLNANVGLSNQ